MKWLKYAVFWTGLALLLFTIVPGSRPLFGDEAGIWFTLIRIVAGGVLCWSTLSKDGVYTQVTAPIRGYLEARTQGTKPLNAKALYIRRVRRWVYLIFVSSYAFFIFMALVSEYVPSVSSNVWFSLLQKFSIWPCFVSTVVLCTYRMLISAFFKAGT